MACCVWSACSRAKPQVAAPLPSQNVLDALPDGATLAVTRPTKGVAELSLWMRAGSRHATVPQLASAAGFWAEQKSGAHARVMPDAVELSLACDTSGNGIAACVRRLMTVFALPAPNANEALRLRERVKSARLRARADDLRQLDLAALRALFGEDAAQLDPLGDAHDEALSADAITQFMHQHYTARRAVLIGVGDVHEADLAHAFASLPAAAPGNAETPRALLARTQVEAWSSDVPALALAWPATSASAAQVLAARVRTLYPEAVLRVIRLQSAPVLLVRAPGLDASMRLLQRLSFDLHRLALEPDEKPEQLRPDESLAGIERELGEAWASRGAVRAYDEPWPIGVALALPSTLAVDSPEAKKKREQWQSDALRAIAAGAELARGVIDGSAGELTADVRAANGVPIHVERRAGDRWFSASIRLGPGSAQDPVTRHGRAALLATLMSEGCGIATGAELVAKLAALDARLEPVVDAQGLGLLVSAPNAHALAALDVLLRCALRPDLSQRTLEDARLRLFAHLEAEPSARYAAHLSQLVAPLAPGTFAPWGTPFGVGEVTLLELRRMHADALQAKRVAVWVASDANAAEVARFVARRVAALPSGNAAPAQPDPGPVRGLGGELTDVPSLRVLVGLRAESSGASTLAAEVFARALADQLATRLGRTLWTGGAARGAFAASGVALSLRETELSSLESALRDALGQLRATPEERWNALLASARLAHVGALSSPAGWARAHFFDALLDGDWQPRERALITRLCQATPAYWIQRPRP